MGTGTATRGKMGHGRSHIHCRRCGNRSYHVRKKKCSSCGFGKSAKIKTHEW